MSQRLFGVKTRSGAPDVTFGEVTYLVSRTAEREHAKNEGDFVREGDALAQMHSRLELSGR